MKECCAEKFPDDGRIVKKHGGFKLGDWGPHRTNDQLDKLTDKFIISMGEAFADSLKTADKAVV